MVGSNRPRVLVISRTPGLRNELVTLLSGYGYYVDYCDSRLDGIRKFRNHKQSIVILDMPILRFNPARLFRFLRKVRRNAIILVCAGKLETFEAMQSMNLGAYDVLQLPLKTEFLKLTLKRALAHNGLLIENLFSKNVFFFGLLMAPLWLIAAFLLLG